MSVSGELVLSLANRIGEIAPLAGRIEEFLRSFGVPGDAIFRVSLALDELLTNIVSYGYDDALPHVIRVSVGVTRGALVVRTEDDGRAFDPFARPPIDTSAGIEERSPGGLGIHLVKEMIEEVAYQRIDGRNRVTLRQPFAGGDARVTQRSKDE